MCSRDLEALGVRVIRTRTSRLLQHPWLLQRGRRATTTAIIVAPDGQRADRERRRSGNHAGSGRRSASATSCCGRRSSAWWVLPRTSDFYHGLRAMREAERAQICMTGVDKVNQLDHNPRLYKQQRIHARFMNTGHHGHALRRGGAPTACRRPRRLRRRRPVQLRRHGAPALLARPAAARS